MSSWIWTVNGRENLHMVWGGFKTSRNELNMSGSGWERAKNEWEWVKNEWEWVGVDGSGWEWVGVNGSEWECMGVGRSTV